MTSRDTPLPSRGTDSSSTSLGRDDRGAAIIEFAIAAPVLLMLIIGMMQVGMALFANAGLRNAVEYGARYAAIYPRPSDADIISTATAHAFGMQSANMTAPTLTHGTSNGVSYVDISMSYNYRFNLLFMSTAPLTLTYSRRAYQV